MRRRAKAAKAPESIEELTHALEELRVMQAELLRQNERLAALRSNLDAERRRYRAYFEFAPASAVTDRAGIIREINAAACKLFGMAPKRLEGKALSAFVGAADRARFRRLLRGLRRRKQASELEIALIPAGVSPRAVSVSVVDVPGDGGEPAVLRWLFRDVTKRRQAEVAIERLSRQNELILTAVGEGAYGVDMEGRIAFANPAAARLTGWSIAELVGRSQHGALHRRKRDGSEYAAEKCPTCRLLQPAAPRYVSADFFRRRDGSTFPVDYTAAPLVEDGRPAGAVVVFNDVSARRDEEERSRQHQAELAHVLRVSTIGEMAATVAHELNQPLAAILSYAKGSERRIEQGADPKDIRAAMERICVQTVRAAEIIRRLRDFVHKREPRREDLNVNEVVRDAAEFLEAEARDRRVELRLELAPRPKPVRVDRVQIEQVILNLARNGFDAMANTEDRPRELLIETSARATDAVEIAISDTGRGLPPEVAKRMFLSFFSTKPDGLGMGLSISRSIVEAHGGRLSASPRPGGGTTFRFMLPVSAGDESDAA